MIDARSQDRARRSIAHTEEATAMKSMPGQILYIYFVPTSGSLSKPKTLRTHTDTQQTSKVEARPFLSPGFLMQKKEREKRGFFPHGLRIPELLAKLAHT